MVCCCTILNQVDFYLYQPRIPTQSTFTKSSDVWDPLHFRGLGTRGLRLDNLCSDCLSENLRELLYFWLWPWALTIDVYVGLFNLPIVMGITTANFHLPGLNHHLPGGTWNSKVQSIIDIHDASADVGAGLTIGGGAACGSSAFWLFDFFWHVWSRYFDRGTGDGGWYSVIINLCPGAETMADGLLPPGSC